MIRTWFITFAALFSLMLSSYSAATMPVSMLTVTTANELTATNCTSDSMQHPSTSSTFSNELDHSTASSLTKNDCHSVKVPADNSKHHHQSSMSDDCCDSTCVASYVYLPTPNAQLIEQSSLLLIEPYLSLLTARPSSSLYRPPIA